MNSSRFATSCLTTVLLAMLAACGRRPTPPSLPAPRPAASQVDLQPLPSASLTTRPLSREVRLSSGRVLSLGDSLGNDRRLFRPRPDGGLALTGAQLTEPAGQLIAEIGTGDRIVKFQVLHPAGASIESMVAAYEALYGAGTRLFSMGGELEGVHWRDSATDLTLQVLRRQGQVVLISQFAERSGR